jgi:hypothetical protein
MRSLFAVLVAVACNEPSPQAPPPPPKPPPLPSSEKANTRFMKIRELLQEKPESKRRAVELYPMVQPICEDEKERKEFIETAKWSASFSTDEVYLTVTLAGDVIEHVATTCFRSHPDATLALLDEAKAAIPNTYRFDLVKARLHAAAGEMEKAVASAKLAKEAGSVHAIALMANIQAQIARSTGVGYRAGMLDDAIATVSVEPDARWQLVDLAAVLSTRARLLTERAVWEDGDAAKKTMLQANAAWERLNHSPFIENIRTRAQDVHCFNTVEAGIDRAACKYAAEESKHLGAAFAAKVGIGVTFDVERYAKLVKLAEQIAELPPQRLVMIVARGDESELIEWARPAGRFLAQIAAKKPRVIAVDRTQSDRARALFERIMKLGGLEPEEIIHSDSTFAMPCLTALVAKRKTPHACPFEKAKLAKLEKLPAHAFTVLIGRDLDAEIDDLHLYELDTVLLSFRQSNMEKGIDAWLKSVSDVLIAAP